MFCREFKFYYRKYVNSDTYKCIYNAQTQATPMNKNKAPLLALRAPSLHTQNCPSFYRAQSVKSFSFNSPKTSSVTHYMQAVYLPDTSVSMSESTQGKESLTEKGNGRWHNNSLRSCSVGCLKWALLLQVRHCEHEKLRCSTEKYFTRYPSTQVDTVFSWTFFL